MRLKKKWKKGGKFYSEYPFLDPKCWQTLTRDSLRQAFVPVLPQVCLLIDYLHELGLVHCDLRFDNFMINGNPDNPRVVLTDMDFLCHADSMPNAKVFGTPEYIAPEILANEKVVIQSDSYSLGIALRLFTTHLKNNLTSDQKVEGIAIDQVEALSDSLTQGDLLHRPRLLIRALYQHELVTEFAYSQLLKSLLFMQLLTRFRTAPRSALNDTTMLMKFIQEENRIFGIHKDLSESLAAAHSKDRLRAFGVFKILLDKAAIERHVDYWYLSMNDKDLEEAYRSLEELKDSHRASVRTGNNAKSLRRTLEQAQTWKEDGKYERAFVFLKTTWDDFTSEQQEDLSSHAGFVYKELAYLASALNRIEESCSYYEKALALEDPNSGSYLELANRFADALYSKVDKDGAKRLVEKALMIAQTYTRDRSVLLLERTRAALLVLDGEYSAAATRLKELTAESLSSGFPDVAVLTSYSLGVLEWRRGEFRAAEKHMTSSIELAELHGMESETVFPLSMLSFLLNENGEYKQAEKIARRAIRNAVTPDSQRGLPFIFTSIVFSTTRTAKYKKAQHWLHRYLFRSQGNPDPNHLFGYYSMLGSLQLHEGSVDSAIETFYKALELDLEIVRHTYQSKLLHNLGLAMAYRGMSAECFQHASDARRILEGLSDPASVAELDLVELLNGHYNIEEQTYEIWANVLQTLVQQDCSYYASLCFIHLVITFDACEGYRALKLISPFMQVIENSTAPLFVAVKRMVKSLHGVKNASAIDIVVLKDVLHTLSRAGYLHATMVVARRIGKEYRQRNKLRLSRKFLMHSLQMAESLGNRLAVESLRRELNEFAAAEVHTQQLIDSIHGISQLWEQDSTYRQSLRQLVRFAVEQTGAERGVLLLRKAETSELYIASSYNVDNDSLQDIKDFSTSIPQNALGDSTPVLIEDAMRDQQTKGYRSVILHNIQSVACIPVTANDQILGTLYLDHHSIPALFGSDDLTYIKSIANFVAVVLKTLRENRSLSAANERLRDRLTGLGAEQTFVTEDPTMLKLFDKLPLVARGNISILISGESGTGKEILCDLIHKLSLRADRPLVKLNCAAISDDLIDSELFGIESKVATGVEQREGKFEAADGGTLFMDEVGDMSRRMQAKVLRALENQQFNRVGGRLPIHTDIRFIYATNRDLDAMVKKRIFRKDLLYRINAVSITIPQLRDRPGDIPLLVEHFQKLFRHTGPPPRFSMTAMTQLVDYDWPGNVRELRNFVEHSCMLYGGQEVTAKMLPKHMTLPNSGRSCSAAHVEKKQIQQALENSDWVQSRAAKLLGLPLSTFRRRVKKYRIIRSS